jgi:uncharacterized membrane protein
MLPATAVFLALLAGWALVAWRAAASLARRRGLTLLAAVLDPRSWTAEPVLGVRARMLLVAWAVACLAVWVGPSVRP